jgi:hypothetical protein
MKLRSGSMSARAERSPRSSFGARLRFASTVQQVQDQQLVGVVGEIELRLGQASRRKPPPKYASLHKHSLTTPELYP